MGPYYVYGMIRMPHRYEEVVSHSKQLCILLKLKRVVFSIADTRRVYVCFLIYSTCQHLMTAQVKTAQVTMIDHDDGEIEFDIDRCVALCMWQSSRTLRYYTSESDLWKLPTCNNLQRFAHLEREHTSRSNHETELRNPNASQNVARAL